MNSFTSERKCCDYRQLDYYYFIFFIDLKALVRCAVHLVFVSYFNKKVKKCGVKGKLSGEGMWPKAFVCN